MAIFRHVWPKSAKMRILIKNRALLFFPLIVPQLHAKFQKNRLSGFRDQFVTSKHTYIHPHKGDLIEPVAFAGSTSIPWNNEPAQFGSLSAIFWGKIFWEQKKIFFEGEKIVFLKKKIEKKILEKNLENIFLGIFSILQSHILTQIDFFRQNHYPII